MEIQLMMKPFGDPIGWPIAEGAVFADAQEAIRASVAAMQRRDLRFFDLDDDYEAIDFSGRGEIEGYAADGSEDEPVFSRVFVW